MQPGIDYFKELAKQGRIHPSDGQVSEMVSGEVVCFAGRYDFNGTAWAAEYNPQDIAGLHVSTAIPQDGAITTGYAMIINKYAPQGAPRPIRTDIEIPTDAPVLGNEWYENAMGVDDVAAFQEACSEIARLWEEEVLPLMA